MNACGPSLPSAAQGEFCSPQFHTFTGTAFTDPEVMYAALWETLGDGIASPPSLEKALNTRLMHPKRSHLALPMIVAVVDEIDQLLSRNHQVVRRLFEWAEAPDSRLVSKSISGLRRSFT